MNHQLIERLRKKAQSSECRNKVAAIAFSHKGDILGLSNNVSRFCRKYGGLHAERLLIDRYGSNIKTILIVRTNKTGNFLPLHPCEKCQKLAKKYGITIRSVDL